MPLPQARPRATNARTHAKGEAHPQREPHPKAKGAVTMNPQEQATATAVAEEQEAKDTALEEQTTKAKSAKPPRTHYRMRISPHDARACAKGKTKKCRCRCRGLLHGKSHEPYLEAENALFTLLKEKAVKEETEPQFPTVEDIATLVNLAHTA